jgi:phage shock protein PspC (stress-responsive transcriptional regulator)
VTGLGEQFAGIDPELLELLRVLLVIDLLREGVERVLDTIALSLLPQKLDYVLPVDFHADFLS